MLKDKLNELKEKDIWTFILFLLYKTKDIPEYSSLSQLCYILNKDELFKLCEYFGGTTIKIPTLDELEIIVYSLLLYQYVEIENKPMQDAMDIVLNKAPKKYKNKIITLYSQIEELVKNYNFTV